MCCLVAVRQPLQNEFRALLSLRLIDMLADSCVLVADLHHPVVCIFILSVLDRPHPVVEVLELFEPSKFNLFALVRQRLDRCQHNRRSAQAHIVHRTNQCLIAERNL